MTTPTTFTAIYEGGLLHPTQPLPLAEGTHVRIIVEPTPPEPAFDQADWERRIRSAKSIQEWMDLANALPPPPDGYDLLRAIEENRILSGGLPRHPDGYREDES
ncbi:MAG: antitoxin family protein [Gemmataceae bacterium]